MESGEKWVSAISSAVTVSTTLASGTYAGAVTAIFTGDNSDYLAAANGNGDLDVS
jgi:hypothetical protein